MFPGLYFYARSLEVEDAEEGEPDGVEEVEVEGGVADAGVEVSGVDVAFGGADDEGEGMSPPRTWAAWRAVRVVEATEVEGAFELDVGFLNGGVEVRAS